MFKPQLVRILVRGVYNDENHRSLGWCEVGSIVPVAGGPYFDSLFEDDKVEPVDERELRQQLEDELAALADDLKAAELFTSESSGGEDVDGESDDTATEILTQLTPPTPMVSTPAPKSRRTQKLK